MSEINEKKYILISIARLRLDDEFLTLWQKNNQGYTEDLFNAGTYTELKDGYHDSDSCELLSFFSIFGIQNNKKQKNV